MSANGVLVQDQVCAGPHLTITQLSTASMLLLLPGSSHGIFTRMTMTSMTGAWYSEVTHFEIILIGLVILKVFILRLLRILPISLNTLFEDGLPYGRRKKRRAHQAISEEWRLNEALFTVLRRLDKQDCLLRSICELQAKLKVPKCNSDSRNELNMAFSLLRRSGQRRKKQTQISNNETIPDPSVIPIFEEAVEIGYGHHFEEEENFLPNTTFNANKCQTRFELCPLTSDDIFHYVDKIQLSDF